MRKKRTAAPRDANQPRFGPDERKLILGVTLRLLRDRDQAEDATQDAMLVAYRHRANFRGDAHFHTWLYRIAATTALMHLRTRRRFGARQDLAPTAVHENVPAPGINPEERFLVEENLAHARRRLADLGHLYGEVVSMRVAEGYSSTEIGRRLGIKAATVKSRVHRGRAVLRAALG